MLNMTVNLWRIIHDTNRGGLRTQGKTRSQADMLIAATAQIHQLTLVTRNTRDFEDCQIPVFNPFTESRA